MKRLSQAAEAFMASYATVHPIRTAIALGIAMGGGTTVFALAIGDSFVIALAIGCVMGVSGFLGARLGEWLLKHGFADQPSLDSGRSEHLSELTYAATSHADHMQAPPG